MADYNINLSGGGVLDIPFTNKANTNIQFKERKFKLVFDSDIRYITKDLSFAGLRTNVDLLWENKDTIFSSSIMEGESYAKTITYDDIDLDNHLNESLYIRLSGFFTGALFVLTESVASPSLKNGYSVNYEDGKQCVYNFKFSNAEVFDNNMDAFPYGEAAEYDYDDNGMYIHIKTEHIRDISEIYVAIIITRNTFDIDVYASPAYKFQYESDPPLTYSYDDSLSPFTCKPAFSGSLERKPGEMVDSYTINQGTLQLENNEDDILYFRKDFCRLVYHSNYFSIYPKPINPDNDEPTTPAP